MKFSTKSRYALRLMAELARYAPGTTVSLKEISERQNLSLKYLEQIVTPLARVGLVKSERGSQGGYRLTKAPADYTAGEILRAIEASLAAFFFAFIESKILPSSVMMSISRTRMANTSTIPVMVITTSEPRFMVFLLIIIYSALRSRPRRAKSDLTILYNISRPDSTSMNKILLQLFQILNEPGQGPG